MTAECKRYQVVLLGNGKCGKTTIIRKYLFGTATEKHTETVEDLYTQRYSFHGKRTYIDYLDTAGSIPFPSMQEIYIKKACSFILVYSITDQQSFNAVKTLWNRIKEAREDILNIPCVVIGNYLDREELREVERFDALSWCYRENLGACMMELSAKDGYGIESIFKVLLQQFGNRRASQWKPQSVIEITKDVCNKEKNKKNRKKKCQIEKHVREINIKIGSQNICYNDIIFEEYSKIDIKRRNSNEALNMKNIKQTVEDIKENNSKHKDTLRQQSGFFRRTLNRISRWRKAITK